MSAMRICGLQKLSMVDFPGKLAATVFTGGCNLRCPFCHNALLVTRLSESPTLPESDVLSFLKTRRGFLDGVVLSGGEPLLQSGAMDFLRQVRDLGYAVKLDTNGCYPAVLEKILSEGLADYVAMDIKNSREKYPLTCGVSSMDMGAIDASICPLRGSGVDYEFRTTVVRELHEEADFTAIGQWLHGAKAYYLQQFQDSGNLIKTGFHSPSTKQMEAFLEAAKPYFNVVKLRGVN